MTKAKLVVFVAVLLAGVGASLFWQQRTLQRLQIENAALRASAAESDRLREENARLVQSQIDPAEIQRLRAGQSELLRLRSEVSQLRQELKEKQSAAAKQAAIAKETPPPASDPPVSPVETYLATTRATVGWQQTLVTGGWTMPSGKRALVLIQPQRVEGGPNEVMLQTRILELPETILRQLGLQGLASENKQSSSQAILTSEQSDALIQALEKTSGVDLLSAPRISTLNDRQAQVKIANELKVSGSGETYETGPLIDVVPHISADGTSVYLNVIAQLRTPVPAR